MSDLDERCESMTQRTYAAIHLRVPDSGIPELDEMIRKSLRMELAGKAMEGLVKNKDALSVLNSPPEFPWNENVSAASYMLAEAMMNEVEK